MTIAQVTTASCLALLGLAHSALGETDILRPLFAIEWTIKTPRWATERILRFAWHLTSISWFALAGLTLGAGLFPTIAISSLASAALVFVMLRGHLAWPLFLLAGLAALHQDGLLSESIFQFGAAAATTLLLAVAGVHIYWAGGGQWMLDRATPKIEGSKFPPGPLLTLAVAAALATFAGLTAYTAFGEAPFLVRSLTMAGVGVLTLRAVGDGRVAGFTKADHASPFGQADDRFFTPLIVILALGAAAALLV